MNKAAGRVFLFLQGPHGPFFRMLAQRLAGQGAGVRRVAFNAADEAEWSAAGPLDRYLAAAEAYPAWIARHLAIHRVTDIVLYGDARPEHARAIEIARQRGIRCHCLEEGYLRPHWITYERGGNNGNSPLNSIGLDRMAVALGASEPPPQVPPDRWGSHYAHLWHSGRYHLRLLLPSATYGRYRSRRSLGLWGELGLYSRRLVGLPLRRLTQGARVRRLLSEGRGYHLALLQLSFDASMQAHSGYRQSAEFVADCIEGFAAGAPRDQLLVFKVHPFEDGRERLGEAIARVAASHGVADRVLFIDSGAHLGTLLDHALTVVTVNSTAAQQALCRGLPVRALGRAVYDRPGLTSDQALAAFFAAPRRPKMRLYWLFRRFLTETSQMRGSFYARDGIEQLLQTLPGALLDEAGPYDRVLGAPVLAPVPLPAESQSPAMPRRAAG